LVRESAGRKKSEDTTEKILVAAIQRFSKFGYRRTSINDVAEEAGLARATVYLYWKRKQDLFVAGLERFNSQSWILAETAAAKKGSAKNEFSQLSWRNTARLPTSSTAQQAAMSSFRQTFSSAGLWSRNACAMARDS